MRKYMVCYWIGDDHFELEFYSDHRAGSKANKYDALAAIWRTKGVSRDHVDIRGVYLI